MHGGDADGVDSKAAKCGCNTQHAPPVEQACVAAPVWKRRRGQRLYGSGRDERSRAHRRREGDERRSTQHLSAAVAHSATAAAAWRTERAHGQASEKTVAGRARVPHSSSIFVRLARVARRSVAFPCAPPDSQPRARRLSSPSLPRTAHSRGGKYAARWHGAPKQPP